MKRVQLGLYVVISVIMIFVAGFILVLYYSQDFDEDFSFESSLGYGDIEFNSNTDYNGNEVLNYAEAEVGTLYLDNNGIFPRVYYFSRLIGCVDFVDPSSTGYNGYYDSFEVQYVLPSGEVYSQEKTSIAVGDEKEFGLIAKYQPYGIPLDTFSRDNLKSISLYELPKRISNPFNSYSRYYYGACSQAREDLEPLAVIPII